MYEATLENAFLGRSRVVKAKTPQEVESKAKQQLSTWAEQEIRQRITQAKKDAKERAAAEAADDDANAATVVQGIRTILEETLDVDDRIDWEELKDSEQYPKLQFTVPTPERPTYPPKTFWSKVLPPLRTRRAARIAAIDSGHSAAMADWEAQRDAEEERHAAKKAVFLSTQAETNAKVDEFRTSFESGDPSAIEEYVRSVFERSQYPDGFFVEHSVAYDAAAQTILVDLAMPPLADVPDVVGVKFVASRLEQTPIRMKPKDHSDMYEEAIRQTVLRTMHEVFEAVYLEQVQSVVVNGWVTSVDPSTGNDRTSCVISVSSSRDEFEEINLARVNSEACVKGLRGLVAGPLSELAPVQPIMQLDRSDRRFVESKEVLAEYNSRTNLAEIPWEDFEHLVRELFGQLFSTPDSEVRVTQASNDGGVDAIAFDPDPVRGG